jgi:gamma-glutamyltranspeptidase / glutathione hydrolase
VFVSEAIQHFCRPEIMDSSRMPHPGLPSGADFAAFNAKHEAPVTADFEGWTVAKCGRWSHDPAFLKQLRLLESFHLRPAGFLSADHIHIVTECAKLTFADREAWYADPDFAKMPIADLLSRDHAAGRRELVAKRASLELRPAAPHEPEPRLPRRVAQTIAQGRWTGAGAQAIGVVRGDTVHVAVADKHGNVVACTSSGGWLQSSP